MSHNARVTTTDESRLERRHSLSPARRRQPLSFLAAQARKLSLSGPLGWAEGARKCHPRKSDGGAAMEALSVLSVFLGLSLGFRGVWAIELVEKLGLGPP